jgi:hypothetical protein
MITLYKRNKRKFLNYITSFLLFHSFLITSNTNNTSKRYAKWQLEIKINVGDIHHQVMSISNLLTAQKIKAMAMTASKHTAYSCMHGLCVLDTSRG